jgi:hypothetical protein
MNTEQNIMETLQRRYVRIEKTIQQLWPSAFTQRCAACAAICCRPHMAEEVLNSPWLQSIAARGNCDYWPLAGTHPLCRALTPSGCCLKEGKPPFCYGFYCDALLENIPAATLISYLYLSNILSALCGLDKQHNLLELSQEEIKEFVGQIDRNLTMAETQLGRYRFFQDSDDSEKPVLALRMVAEMPRLLSRSVCRRILE